MSRGGSRKKAGEGYCIHCVGEHLASQRIDENHISIALGDEGRIAFITLNGYDVTSRCSEAYRGNPGYVILNYVDEDGHPIPHMRPYIHAFRERIEGNVMWTLKEGEMV